MTNRKAPVFIIMFLFAFLGFWQFSQGVRSVDVVSLAASGALAGAAVVGFWMSRNKTNDQIYDIPAITRNLTIPLASFPHWAASGTTINKILEKYR